VGSREKRCTVTTRRRFSDVEAEVCADEAACQHRDDRACGSWQDDVDVGDYEGIGVEEVGELHAV
jgi:hypothetical protein